MKIIMIVLLMAVFFLALAIGAENQELVNFNYLIAQGDFSLSILIGFFFVAGFLFGWLILGSLYFSANLIQLRLKKRLNMANTELETFRSKVQSLDVNDSKKREG